MESGYLGSAGRPIFSSKVQSQSVKANENLTRSQFFSPIDLPVSKLNVEKGEKVVGTNQFPGTELMTVARLNAMK